MLHGVCVHYTLHSTVTAEQSSPSEESAILLLRPPECKGWVGGGVGNAMHAN
jgi:hypothetical protein